MTDPFTAFLIVWASISTASIALAALLWGRQCRGHPVRPRASTHLTPKYEARRVREIRAARERFNLIPDGGVRRHQQEGN